MPDPDRLLKTIKAAVQHFRATPGRRGRVVCLHGATDVLVGGDMHGHVENFRALLDRAKLREHPTRHLVVQELVHGTREYPGGGDNAYLDGAILATFVDVNPSNDAAFLATYNAQASPSGDGGSPEYFSNATSVNGYNVGQGWVGGDRLVIDSHRQTVSSSWRLGGEYGELNCLGRGRRLRPASA